MHDFCYVSKKEAAPVKAELLDIIHEVQDIVRDDFTFQFTFIGSSSRNMITYDRKSNIGFDFDINIEVNDDDENYEPKEIRTIIRKALDKVARQYGYDYCEDSTRVLTIKKKDRPNSRIRNGAYNDGKYYEKAKRHIFDSGLQRNEEREARPCFHYL